MKFKDIDILEFGNTIQITGFILTRGKDEVFLVSLPGESAGADRIEDEILEMELDDWEAFFQQSDVLNTAVIANVGQLGVGAKKIIVRKTQRQIDANVSWAVFKRDEYQCRYCGSEGPLTVDHIVLWEEGGPSIQDNLLTACRKCNRTRGNMPYKQWINSWDYKQVSEGIPLVNRLNNYAIIEQLPKLEAKKVAHVRSR